MEVAAGAGVSEQDGGNGQGTYFYSYTRNQDTLAVGSNAWAVKTVVTRPDTTHDVVFTNGDMQVILFVHEETNQSWADYYRYDAAGRLVLEASPSAVSGYDPNLPDLVGVVNSNATYLRDSSGLITTYSYGQQTTATDTVAGDVLNRLKGSAIRQGELTTDVPISSQTYLRNTAVTGVFYNPASNTMYAGDNSTDPRTSMYNYQWSSTNTTPSPSNQPYSVTVTLPAVAKGHNGSGTSAVTKAVFDAFGRPVWTQDAEGYLGYTKYDVATGVAIEHITDVNTTFTSDYTGPVPAGWVMIDGLHVHLKEYAVPDALGRVTKTVSQDGRVDYTVYNDPLHEVRYYPAWANVAGSTTKWSTTGPVQVVRDERYKGQTATYTASLPLAGVANSIPTGTETLTFESFTRDIRNEAGQVTATDSYYAIGSLSYAIDADTYDVTYNNVGGVNNGYYRSTADFGTASGRLNRSVSAAGTITRFEYDGLGRVMSEWVGTDDTPASGFWPVHPTGPVSNTNMVKVRSYEYDGGGVGDGNLTKMVEYPNGATNQRVTQSWYDWRNRSVAIKGAVNGLLEATDGVNRPILYTTYNNLDESVTVEQYLGNGITIASLNGVPQQPSAGLLRAKQVMLRDEFGRTYQSKTYSVSPTNGSISETPLSSLFWFDDRGLPVASLMAGGSMDKVVYDGAGRVTTEYVTDSRYPVSELVRSFHRLFGDAGGSSSGDGDVDTVDLAFFRSSFNTISPDAKYKSYNDFDGDGDIDSVDFAQFRLRFGITTGVPTVSTGVVRVTVNDFNGDGIEDGYEAPTSGTPQRSKVTSLSVRFDAAVTLKTGVFKLTGVSLDGTTLLADVIADFTYTTVDGVTTAILTFPAGDGVENAAAGALRSLKDGIWSLVVDRNLTALVGGGHALLTTLEPTPDARVAGDIVLRQTNIEYDDADNVIKVTTKERFHDATGLGVLGTATTGVHARVSYAGAYYDGADRLVTTINVGTFGGGEWVRPISAADAKNDRSDNLLRTDTTYDSAGFKYRITDPRDKVAQTTYDDLGRVARTIENYINGTAGTDDDKTTDYFYGPAGMTKLTAYSSATATQSTEWVYGVGASIGDLFSNDVVHETKWPDPVTGLASSTLKDTVIVNSLGEAITATDRNGTVHSYAYDLLGRITSDSVTALVTANGIDSTVLRIEKAYDEQGNAYLTSSYSSAAGGGTPLNQVRREFNGLGQLTSEWQAHGAAVDTATTPRVGYGYTEMANGANHSRLTSMAYPNGKVLNYVYDGDLNDNISRLTSLGDTGVIESYDFLGHGTVVRRAHPLPSGTPGNSLDISYITAPDPTGDQYRGLDRFGRIADQNWTLTGGGSTDHFGYTYDPNGNRLTKSNVLQNAFSETYTYDGVNQIKTFARQDRTQSWDYDALGNWSKVTTNGTPQSRTHNAQNQVTGVTTGTATQALTFDKAGNMTTDETGRQLSYDAWNRLVKVRDSIVAFPLRLYRYDGLSRKITEKDGPASAVTTDLYYSESWQVLEERAGGQVASQYVWSSVYIDALVLRDRDTNGDGAVDERLWVQQDANWNVTALVNGSGVVVERFVYDPFGAVTVHAANYVVRAASLFGWVYGFQGLRADASAGLSEARHRWYSPTLGRWVTVDPLGFGAGDGDLYRMVGNGPITFTDPFGLTKGGKQNIRPSDSTGRETAAEAEAIYKALCKDPTASKAHVASWKGYAKVLKRGGTFGVALGCILAAPDIATAAEKDGVKGVARETSKLAAEAAVATAATATVGATAIGVTGAGATTLAGATGVGTAVIVTAVAGHELGNAIGETNVGGRTVHDHIAEATVPRMIFGDDNINGFQNRFQSGLSRIGGWFR